MPGVQVIGLDRFIQHVGRVATEAKRLDKTTVAAVAAKSKATLLATAASDAPGLKLSRFANGRGISLSARVTVTQDGPEAIAAIFPTPPGPWYLLEKGAKAHQIGRRARRRRGQGGFLGSRERGFAAMGPVDHPATAGKHTFSKGADAAIAFGQASFASAGRHAYLKMFAG